MFTKYQDIRPTQSSSFIVFVCKSNSFKTNRTYI